MSERLLSPEKLKAIQLESRMGKGRWWSGWIKTGMLGSWLKYLGVARCQGKVKDEHCR